MTTKHKATGRAKTVPLGIAEGLTVSILITVIGAAIIAWMISSSFLKNDKTGYAIMAILFLAPLAGCLTSAKLIKHETAKVCLITGICHFVTLLVITGIAFHGEYSEIWVPLGLTVMGVLTSILLARKSTKRYM